MGVPSWVIGGIRYDADNYWVAELDVDGDNWEIVDLDKAAWGTVNGYRATYDANGEVSVDLGSDPEDDPAGPWDDWQTPPDPWPPEDD